MRLDLKFLIAGIFIAIPLHSQTNDWPVFRGNADLAGVTDREFSINPGLLWSHPTGSGSKSSPVISGGTVYFGNSKGTVYAISSEKKVLWTFETGSPVDAPSLVAGNKVVIGSSDGLLRALDKTTGKQIWSYKTDNQIVGSANYWEYGSKVGIVAGSYDYYLHCVEPTAGKSLWKLETMNYVNGTPAVSGDKIVFGGCDGIMRIADPITGLETDTIEIGIYIASSPALSGGMAYFGDYDGNLYCLDLGKRKISWRIPPSPTSGSINGIPAVGYNSIVIGNDDKHMYCYDLSGKLKWKFRTNGPITGSAVLSPSRVLFGSNDGFIYLLNLADGSKIWSFNAGSPITGSPAVSGDRFYFLTDDGRLLAFGNKK